MKANKIIEVHNCDIKRSICNKMTDILLTLGCLYIKYYTAVGTIVSNAY